MKLKVKREYISENQFVEDQHFTDSIGGEIKICTDSRSIESDEWFLPIKGEKFDGHKFISSLKNKCAGVIFESSKISRSDVLEVTGNLIQVSDTTYFLQECGRESIKSFKSRGGLVIGLTGSNGKTTNKEYLASILNAVFPGEVYSTEGNFNNHLGVPFTCLAIQESHKIALIEMGTNHFGEIQTLCSIAMPDVGFITNIGDAHLEFLIDRAGVLREKRALYDYVIENSQHKFKFLINGEDEKLLELSAQSESVFNSCDFLKSSSARWSILWKGEEIIIENKNIFGNINFQNLAFVTLFALILFPDKEKQIKDQISLVVPPKNNRSMWKKWKNSEVFLDAYNANPSSMKVSLESFMQHVLSHQKECGKVLFILGDMKELGDSANLKHREVGIQLANFLSSFENAAVFFIGEHANSYAEGLGDLKKRSTQFKSCQDVAIGHLENYQTIFVKGSRSIALESLFS